MSFIISSAPSASSLHPAKTTLGSSASFEKDMRPLSLPLYIVIYIIYINMFFMFWWKCLQHFETHVWSDMYCMYFPMIEWNGDCASYIYALLICSQRHVWAVCACVRETVSSKASKYKARPVYNVESLPFTHHPENHLVESSTILWEWLLDIY